MSDEQVEKVLARGASARSGGCKGTVVSTVVVRSHRVDCAEDVMCAADAARVAQARGNRHRRARGVASSDTQRMKELERENEELRRANDMLKLASPGW